MERLCQWFLYFTAYSFLGWCCECLYCALCDRKWVNRGFLNGPLCPIYGFGAMAVLYLLRPFTENLFTLFLASMVITSALEYFTGWLLERLFHLKLWDYTGYFCNLNGRVCLRNSILFGLMGVALVWVIHPWLEGKLLLIPRGVLLWLSLGLFVVLAADMWVTVRSALQLRDKLAELHQLAEDLREKTEESLQEHREQLEERRAQLEERLSLQREHLNRQLMAVREKYFQRRFIKAFPNMTSPRSREALERLKQAIADRKKH